MRRPVAAARGNGLQMRTWILRRQTRGERPTFAANPLKEDAMKFPSICALLLLTVAGAAVAQTPPTASEAKKDVQAQKQDPLAIQSSSAEDWSMLKGHDKGYVTKGDALPNSWLAQNFVNCDTDRDGKVTQAEYDKCRKKQER
jgi:hypothetical protein